MLVVSESTRKQSTPLEAGSYIARCVQIIDLGDQFNDMSQKYVRKVMLTFELPTERLDVNGETKPRLLSKTYTFSMNEKGTLRKDIQSWFGRQLAGDDFPFNLKALIGLPCMLTVVSKQSKTGNAYSVIGSIAKPMKGIAIPEQETPSLIFDIDGKDAVEEVEKLPEWIAKTIKESPSFKAVLEKQDDFTDINKDDLPF